MATTIKSTALDFDAIKNNLKTHLAAQDEFSDYNFEASGLSNILDVLAYNTHYNGLIANFALNESFLGTAQIRSSIISLAEGIGYIPDSKTASQAVVNLSLNLADVSGRPNTIQINDGFKFNTTVDDIDYVFQTVEDITATDDGNGFYEFKDALGSANIIVKEGTSRTKTFLIGTNSEDNVYIIPDRNIDIETAIVRVFTSATSSSFSTYTNILDARTINSSSTLYILKESPNGFFELSFGDGNTLGAAPTAGQKAVITYLSTSGPDANLATTFTPQSQVTVSGTGYDLSVTTETNSFGGAAKETIESIRKNAPFQYATQNRMVTAVDYSSLVLRNFSNVIKDIKAFGGEDALEPEFGTVFLSILFNDDVTDTVKQSVKDQIEDLSEQLSVASFSLKFEDPIKTFIETTTFFQFNKNLTTLSKNSIKDIVSQAVADYMSTSTGKFGQSFRRSNMLTDVDATSSAVLSSRANVRMQRRFTPTLTAVQAHTLRYVATIASPSATDYRITSSPFTFRNKTCILRNKLSSNKLEVFNQEDQAVVVDNAGDYSDDTIRIVGLQVDSFVGGNQFIKLKATPANESVLTPFRQDIVEFDANESSVNVVDVAVGVTN